MVYRRSTSPGTRYFFTVTLNRRDQSLLTEHIGQQRRAFNSVKERHPLHIDAIVKHRHVARAADWPYSSIHRFIAARLLSADWAWKGEGDGDPQIWPTGQEAG